MTSRQALEFPAPAGDLWIRNRDTIARALAELETEYAIGGGTVLAARWQHRRSYDIDLAVPEGTRLGELDDHRFHWFQEAMENQGAIAEYSPKLNFVNFRFGTGPDAPAIQIWAYEPILKAGHGPEVVSGKTETLLSNAQILRGKLERSDKKLSRDVYDVLKAREVDPEHLEIAVSTMRHEEVSSIVSDWLHGRETIVAHADSQLRRAIDGEVDYRTMAVDAAFALIDSRYDRFRIVVDRKHITAEAVTEGGNERVWEIKGTDAEKRFASLGFENHLLG